MSGRTNVTGAAVVLGLLALGMALGHAMYRGTPAGPAKPVAAPMQGPAGNSPMPPAVTKP